MKCDRLICLSAIMLLMFAGCGKAPASSVPAGGEVMVTNSISSAASTVGTAESTGSMTASASFTGDSTVTVSVNQSRATQTAQATVVPTSTVFTAPTAPSRAEWSETRQLLLLTDQKNRRLVMLDSADTDWTDAGSVVWEWKPTQENGFLGFASSYWLPSEAKLRYSEQYHTYVILTCASGGTCAMLEYPSGKKLWATTKESGNNPHSMELLPNGNIAVASSGGTVRIYAASQPGDAGQRFAEVELDSAHGVEWDAGTQRLIAVYYHGVRAYTIGTASQPVLTEDTAMRADHEWLCGHDLISIPGKAGQYWITGSGGLWTYHAVTHRLETADPELSNVNGDYNIKSVDVLPDGTMIRAMPRQGDENRPDLEQYQSGAVVFTYWSAEKKSYVSTMRALPSGMAIYKVRSFTPRQ